MKQGFVTCLFLSERSENGLKWLNQEDGGASSIQLPTALRNSLAAQANDSMACA